MRFAGAVLLLSLAMAGFAYACPPPPGPPMREVGESEETYNARISALRAEAEAASLARRTAYQRQLWEESASVVLARVERTDRVPLRDIYGQVYSQSPRAHLRPVHWLKGSRSSRRFHVRYTGDASCGPYGGGDAVSGEVGEVFVVFVREGRPSQATIADSLALDNILDSELLERVRQFQDR